MKNKILILGGGKWLTPYIIKAKELGLTTYVTDWEENAEGRKFAHHFACIDLKDKEATLEYAKKHSIEAIFTSADIGVPTAAWVAQHLDIQYHKLELALCATDKSRMREKAREINLPIPEFSCETTLTGAIEASNKIGFPVIIKPIDNFSSRGVAVLNNESELLQNFDNAINNSFAGKILIEEFMVGEEGSVEALIQGNEVHFLGICSKKKSNLPYRYDLRLDYPGHYTSEQFDQIKNFIRDLVQGFEIKQGIIHVEFMIAGLDVKLIEFGIRGCGSHVVTKLLPAMLNYDIVEHMVLEAVGIKKQIVLEHEKFGALQFIMFENGTVKTLTGVAEAKKTEGIIDIDIELAPGNIISDIKDGRSRPGYILAVENSNLKMNNSIEKALKNINLVYL